MIALITTSVPTLDKFRLQTWKVGRLLVPGMSTGIPGTIAGGYPWAADSGGFKGVDYRSYMAMLAKLPRDSGCRFVVPPDVVGDAVKTRALFDRWRQIIVEGLGLPVAYVLQDGLESVEVPWDQCDALFIGGTTPFKLSDLVRRTVAEGREAGKWIHMGRVNTPDRAAYARAIGCDSFDGSQWGRYPERDLPELVSILEEHPREPAGQEVML